MPNVSEEGVALLQHQYQSLFSHVNDVLDGTTGLDDSEKQQFFEAVKQSHDNLVDAIANGLKADDATWAHVSEVVQATQRSLDAALKDLSNLSNQLALVTNAVNTVAQAVKVFGI